MENFNPDPKPGRLILPLVLIGMIATTYTFINRVTTNNNLEVINIDDNTTEEVVTDEVVVDTTTTSTTTGWVNTQLLLVQAPTEWVHLQPARTPLST